MTALTLDTAPDHSAASRLDELDHVTCCDDDNLAICGTDVTRDEWVAPESPTTCVVCAALEETTYRLGSCATVCPKRSAVAS